MKLRIYTDGGARGNPGPAGIGAVLYDTKDKVVDELSEYIGKTTNNQAEYQALVKALTRAESLGATECDCYLDSELVVKQLNGEYKVKDPDLAPWYLKIHNLTVQIGKVSFTHIRREKNTVADALANKAMDDHK
ncbi:MAG: ribonuclease HI family protein [Candidatus Kerfeldbacteria bacterium]